MQIKDGIGKVGATQCGKTYVDTLFIIPNRIAERSDKKGLNFIVGVSKETIQRNIIEPLQEIYGNKVVTNISSNNTCEILGEKVYCIGADNAGRVKKFRGPRVKYLYIDEIYDINEDVFQLLKSRLSFSYSCCDFAGNPQHPTHWFELFLKSDIDLYLQRYTLFDNPFLTENYVTQLCKEYEGTVFYNRYILGQACSAEGIIFNQIANNKNRFITDKKLQGNCYIGIDWGGNRSYHSFTATTISYNYNQMQVIKSSKLKATETGTEELFEWIIQNIREIASCNVVKGIFCDSAEQVLINSLKKELLKNNLIYTVYNSDKIKIKDRIELLNIMLNTDRISFIENRCNETIEALQTAIYDSKIQDCWLDDSKTSDIDSIDSFCYSWTHFYKKIARS